jgi:AraC-like DNA-binding protein
VGRFGFHFRARRDARTKPKAPGGVQPPMGNQLTIWKEDFIAFASTGMIHIGSENRPPSARGWSSVESTGEQPALAFSLLPIHVEFEHHDPVVLSPATVAITASKGAYVRSAIHAAGQRTIFFRLPQDFMTGYCAQLDPSISDRLDDPYPDRCAPACPRAIAMARQLERLIFESDSIHDPMQIEECALRILERSFQALLSPAPTRRRIEYSRETSQVQRRQVNDAAAALASNPGHRWSLSMLADDIGLSPGYLSRTFREHTGSTITQYLSILRVIHALQSLPAFKGNLTRLAYESGFSSHAHMTTVFMKLVGRTPSSMTVAHHDEVIEWLVQKSKSIDRRS